MKKIASLLLFFLITFPYAQAMEEDKKSLHKTEASKQKETTFKFWLSHLDFRLHEYLGSGSREINPSAHNKTELASAWKNYTQAATDYFKDLYESAIQEDEEVMNQMIANARVVWNAAANDNIGPSEKIIDEKFNEKQDKLLKQRIKNDRIINHAYRNFLLSRAAGQCTNPLDIDKPKELYPKHHLALSALAGAIIGGITVFWLNKHLKAQVKAQKAKVS